MTDESVLTRWKVRRVSDMMCPDCPWCWGMERMSHHIPGWRVWNSNGDWDSDYLDWNAAVAWAASPAHRIEYYANGGVH